MPPLSLSVSYICRTRCSKETVRIHNAQRALWAIEHVVSAKQRAQPRGLVSRSIGGSEPAARCAARPLRSTISDATSPGLLATASGSCKAGVFVRNRPQEIQAMCHIMRRVLGKVGAVLDFCLEIP